MNTKRHHYDILWDAWCVASLVGIWPRFIEPRLLSPTKLSLSIPQLPPQLNGLKILQFSDLHFQPRMTPAFLNKIIKKTRAFTPDIIVFTGDFLCYALLSEPQRLVEFLNSFKAPYGCYAVLGNHDYSEYVSANGDGDYDVAKQAKSPIKKGWKRLLYSTSLTGKTTSQVKQVQFNQELTNLLAKTPFTLLHNETIKLLIHGCTLNLCGLGEYMLDRCQPEIAFKNYDSSHPGIVLLHNPDGTPLLKNYPGDVILCGHTHGAQINIPGMRHKFMLLENTHLRRGLKKYENKWIYINRGVGGVMPFRWFSRPELLLLTLQRGSS